MQRFLRPARLACSCAALAALAGCAGLKTTEVLPDDVNGVAYYMPMKAFVLTVTLVGGNVTKLEWKESPPIPDLRRTYALSYDPHWIGKTSIDVSVGANGLLGVTNTATTDSSVELGKILPKGLAAAALKVEPEDKCPTSGDLAYFFYVPGEGEVCGGIKYHIKPVPLYGSNEAPPPGSDITPRGVSARQGAHGVFYRQNRPYTATASSGDGSVLATSLLAVPNESPTMFLPFARTLFAANDAKVTFDDGILKTYKQVNEGELVALLQFPASIASAYFTAVGNLFTAFSNKDSKDAELKLKELKLDLFRAQLAKCKEAFEAADAPALKALDCSNLSIK